MLSCLLIHPLANTLVAAAEGEKTNAYRNFINTVDSEATRQSYKFTFTKFMKFTGVDVEDYSRMLQIEPKKLEGLIGNYITHMKVDKKLSYNTVNLHFASISHFYVMNDVTLNWKKLAKFKGKKRLVVEDNAYSKDQIRQLLDFADLRTKCLILLMSSAGLRRGAIPRLRIGDLTKIKKYGLYKISVYKKEAEAYTAYCTPEAANHLDQYFEWRAMQGERLNEASPVLRKQFSSLNVARPQALTVDSINWLINNLLDKSCIRPRSPDKWHKTDLMQNHAFRKYFETTATLAGLDSLYIQKLMGHDTGLRKPYSKLTAEDILEGNDRMTGYVGAINALTINSEFVLKSRITELEQKNNEVEELRQELSEMQSSQKEVLDLLRSPKELMKLIESDQ